MILVRHVVVMLWAAFWIGFLAWSRYDFVAIAALVLPLYYQTYVRRDVVGEIVERRRR